MIDEPWAGDTLNRKADGEHIIGVLLNRYEARRKTGGKGYTLNLDARWGEGKTFFLRNLQADLVPKGFAVAMVNAWEDDHGDDPLTSVMAAIDDMVSRYPIKGDVQNGFDKAKRAAAIIGTESAKQVGLHLLKLTTGIAVGSIIEKMNDGAQSLDAEKFEASADKALENIALKIAEQRIDDHRAASNAIRVFGERIEATIKAISEAHDVKLPMIVFIDELDRCRPLYAIKMLESIKHLFSIDGLAFIVATDSEQLAHSVRAIYGEGFDSNRYLRRFFDRVFVSPRLDLLRVWRRHTISISRGHSTGRCG